MGLDIPALTSCVILQLATYRIKCVSDRHRGVFMFMVQVWFSAGHESSPRDSHFDVDMVRITLTVMPVVSLDHNAATHCLIVKPTEVFRHIADVCLHLLGGLHVAEGNL
jgi:hypothetical protein